MWTHKKITLSILLFLVSLFSTLGCFQDPDDYIIYVNKYHLNISDIDETVFIDSIRIHVSAPELDTSILFQNVENTDLVQFNFEISKNKRIQVDYMIYHDEVVLKEGRTDYLSGTFLNDKKDSLDHFILHQNLIDSVKVVILNSLKVGFTNSDTLRLSESTHQVTLEVIIPLMLTEKTLIDSCEVKIEGRNAAKDDLIMDSLVVFPMSATIGEKISLDIDMIDDRIIEGTENFELTLRPICPSHELYRGENYKKVITLEDNDSVEIQYIPGDLNIKESDSSFQFEYLVLFSEGADSLNFPIEITVSPFTTLQPEEYALSYNLIKLHRSTQNGDTLTIPVKFLRQNNIQEEEYSENFIINTSTDSSHLIKISSQAYVQVLNDDFSYYLISDTLAQKIIMLDHQFNLIRAHSFSGKTLYDIDQHSLDTIRLSTLTESIYWSIRDNESYELSSPLGYQIENVKSEPEDANHLIISLTELKSVVPLIEVFDNPSASIPTFDFSEYTGNTPIWLKNNPYYQHVEAHYYNEDLQQFRIIEMTLNDEMQAPLDTFVTLSADWQGVEYTGGVAIDSLGNRFYTINSIQVNGLDTQQTAAIIQIDKDFFVTPILSSDYLSLIDWDAWAYKVPGPIVVNLQGDLVTIDPANSTIVKVNQDQKAVISSQYIPELTSHGTWSLFELRTQSPIEYTLD